MVERLTVIFFIVLCFLLGMYLIFAPWDMLFGPWADNALLAFVADRSGIPAIQAAVASTWARGAVTGLGVLNIVIGAWEILNFENSVKMLGAKDAATRR
jgi:hypothetical protein